MKIVKIIFLSVLGFLVVTGLGAFIFLKTLDVNQFLPKIAKSASDAIGRPVHFGHAQLNLSWQGIALKVERISIDNDFSKSSKPLLKIDKANLNVELMPLITKHEIHTKEIHLTAVSILTDQLPVYFSSVDASVDMDMKDISRAKIIAYIASGRLEVDAGVQDYLKTQVFKANVNIVGVKVQEFIDQTNAPVVVNGDVNGTVLLSGSGFSPDVLIKNLTGSGELTINHGRIEKSNILKTILGSTFNVIPGLADGLDAILTGALSNKLGADRTAVDQGLAKFTIHDAIIALDQVLIATGAFEMNAHGTLGFDMTMNVQTTLLVAQDLSQDLVEQVEQFALLQDANKRVKITGDVVGVMPAVKFVPTIDVKQFAKNVIVEEGTKQLQKVIDKNPEVGVILNNVLDRIFK